MNLRKGQVGIGLVESLFYLLAVIFVAMSVIKLGPAYLEAFSVQKIMRDLVEDQTQQGKSPVELKSVIAGRFNMSRIENPTMEDVIIQDKQTHYMIDANYENRISLFGNIDVVLKFDDLVYELPKGERITP